MSNPRLREWEVLCFPGQQYIPPELQSRRLAGKVYGHPSYKDGDSIKTSAIVSTNGLVIECESRSYVLEGPPSANYLDWLKGQGLELDPAEPVKLK